MTWTVSKQSTQLHDTVKEEHLCGMTEVGIVHEVLDSRCKGAPLARVGHDGQVSLVNPKCHGLPPYSLLHACPCSRYHANGQVCIWLGAHRSAVRHVVTAGWLGAPRYPVQESACAIMWPARLTWEFFGVV